MLQLLLCSLNIIAMWTAIVIVSHSFNTILLCYRVSHDSKLFKCLASYSGYAWVRIASSVWQCFSETCTLFSFPDAREKEGVTV